MNAPDPDRPPPIFSVRNVALFLVLWISASLILTRACGIRTT